MVRRSSWQILGADNWCVASELLPAEPVDERWAIKGEFVELSR
jgi:hypothetical protein